MSEHQCFTVSATSYVRNLTAADRREQCFAIHYQKAPKQHEGGGMSLSIKYPTLVVTGYLAEPEMIAQRVADILNKHWDDGND